MRRRKGTRGIRKRRREKRNGTRKGARMMCTLWAKQDCPGAPWSRCTRSPSDVVGTKQRLGKLIGINDHFAVQQLGSPDVLKMSLYEAAASGGQELFIIGRNFNPKGIRVLFREYNNGAHQQSPNNHTLTFFCFKMALWGGAPMPNWTNDYCIRQKKTFEASKLKFC